LLAFAIDAIGPGSSKTEDWRSSSAVKALVVIGDNYPRMQFRLRKSRDEIARFLSHAKTVGIASPSRQQAKLRGEQKVPPCEFQADRSSLVGSSRKDQPKPLVWLMKG
jgi:hypothetical protein